MPKPVFLPFRFLGDGLGILTSSICFIHCLASPTLVFLGMAGQEWPWLKYVFVIMAFLSIWFSMRKQTPIYIIIIFWVLFWCFLFSVFYEDQSPILEYTGMASSVGIIICHMLNLRSCRHCADPNTDVNGNKPARITSNTINNDRIR